MAVSGGSASFVGDLIVHNTASGGAGYGGGLYVASGAITILKLDQFNGNAASTAGNDIYGSYTNG